jgi:L-proline---[L-prolyl-carrier protein] ligase
VTIPTDALHDLLGVAAANRPGHPAVVDGDRTLTYAQLDDEVNRLAGLLAHAGVRPGDRVALHLPKCAEAIIAMYAVLAADAAYVPLDPVAPAARLSAVVEDSGARCVIGSVRLGTQDSLPATASVDSVVLSDDPTRHAGRLSAGARWFGRGDVDHRFSRPPRASGGGDGLAYILYTSGSTGKPKGAMLSHRNALAFVRWAATTCALTDADRIACHAPLHFDLSIFDVFTAAMAAATLVLVPPRVAVFPTDVAALIERAGITVWYSVPSALTMLLDRGDLSSRDLTRLRLVAFAGEVFPLPHLRRLIELLPHARLLNLYGPTETNVCMWHEVRPPLAPSAIAIPIGRTIDDVTVWAMTGDGRIAAPGEPGELYVRGSTVMRGYWNDPARTTAVLVPAPDGVGLAYRTGDLVRHDGHGTYHFIGRRDHQVKIRGHRVELGDVEAALHRHPAVAECAALAVPDAAGALRLVAVVAAAGTSPVELHRHCASLLPRSMRPDRIELHPALPRTSTGKTDRIALRAAVLAAQRQERAHVSTDSEPVPTASSPTASVEHYAQIWETYWRTTIRDGQSPLWDVAADLADVTQLMDTELPIIDVGCGNGTQTRQLADHFHRIVGADTSPSAIALARRTHPHPSITYLVLDIFDRNAAAALHHELGDANVYLRGVLHQIDPDLRAAFTAGLRLLLGDRGTLYLLELAPAATGYLQDLGADHGPPAALDKIIRLGIQPSGLTPPDAMALLGPGYDLISTGADVIRTTHQLPDGHAAQIPAFHLAARRAL